MRFSVIIASYLSDYPGAATDRVRKFEIAITSALNQYPTPEIIVVSDGCEITNQIIENHPVFSKKPNIKLVKIPKQELHSGKIRQAGMDIATGEYQIFLDTDDFYGPLHLSIVDYLLTQHGNPDFGYFDTIKFTPINVQKKLETQYKQFIFETALEKGRIGNGNLVFKRSLGVKYEGIECSTFIPGIGEVKNHGHDFIFTQRILEKAKTVKLLKGLKKSDVNLFDHDSVNKTRPLFPQYYVCHEPGQFDH